MSRTDRTSVDFLALTISARKGRKVTDENGQNRYRYTVTVQSDATGARTSFDFTAAAVDFDAGISQLAPRELLWAFRCFVEDAAAGDQSFTEFADDFGYDHDSYSARRTWEACRRARAKFGRLWHDAREPAWVLDQLGAEGVE